MKYVPLFLLATALASPALAHDSSVPHAHSVDWVGFALLAGIVAITAYAFWKRRT